MEETIKFLHDLINDCKLAQEFNEKLSTEKILNKAEELICRLEPLVILRGKRVLVNMENARLLLKLLSKYPSVYGWQGGKVELGYFNPWEYNHGEECWLEFDVQNGETLIYANNAKNDNYEEITLGELATSI